MFPSAQLSATKRQAGAVTHCGITICEAVHEVLRRNLRNLKARVHLRMVNQELLSNDSNTFDFLQGVDVLSWHWNNLGTVFSSVGAPAQSSRTLAGKCSFVVKRGVDPLGGLPIGRTVEGCGDLGFNVKHKRFGVHLSIGNLWYKTGVDEPVKAQIESTKLPSLKVSIAKQLARNADEYVGASYDVRTGTPELSYCFSSTTLDSRATMLVAFNPKDVSVNLNAAVELPGPEWRVDLYDEETSALETVKDDGLRHQFFLQHELTRADFFAKTRVGCKLSAHRAVNWLVHFIDNNWRHRIPTIVYRVPFAARLVDLLLPDDNDEQVRINLRGWEVDLHHDFDQPQSVVGLTKRNKFDALSFNYNLSERAVGVEYSRKIFQVGVKLGNLEGVGWKKPSIHFAVQPLLGFN